jgi:hypothetical protein
VEERVKGLDYGADDYIPPFHWGVFEAQRAPGRAGGAAPHGPLVYDQSGRVTIVGRCWSCRRELGLLVLLQRAGRSGQQDQLVERLCEWGEEVSNNAIRGLANPPLAQKISKSARFASPQSAAFRAASKKKYQPKPEVASHGRAIHMRLSARTTKPFRGGNPGLMLTPPLLLGSSAWR